MFSAEDNAVLPWEFTLQIYPFGEMWERDKSEHKEVCGREFAYIFFYCSLRKDNPYKGYIDDTERHEKIVEGLYHDFPDWQPDALVKDGILAYEDYQENASQSLKYYKSVRKALDTLRQYWETLDMTKTTKTGMLVNKPSDVARGIEQTSSLLVKLADLEGKVQQELLTDSKTRGNRVINHFEK